MVDLNHRPLGYESFFEISAVFPRQRRLGWKLQLRVGSTSRAVLANWGDIDAVGSENSEPLIPKILSRSALEGETSFKFR